MVNLEEPVVQITEDLPNSANEIPEAPKPDAYGGIFEQIANLEQPDLINGTAGGLVVLLVSIYFWRRGRGTKTVHKRSQQVNCWFCNEDQVVESYKVDGFVCRKCEQYNGFTKDGDYNQVIPEQHYNSLNDQKFNSIVRQNTKRYTKTTESLCDKCNSEQWMKLRREREFNPDIPSDDEEGYEQALRGFRTQLDKEYPLCIKCEYLLKAQELGKYNPLYQKWLSEFRRRTISGTGDFLEAVSHAQDLQAYSRTISHRVARYMTSQALSALTLPTFSNFTVDVINATIHRILRFSPMLRIIPLPTTLLTASQLLPFFYLVRITGIIVLSESYFGIALRLFWIFDITTTYLFADWWSEYVWATFIVSCGMWAAINSLAALCVSTTFVDPMITPTKSKSRLNHSQSTLTPERMEMSSGQLTPPWQMNRQSADKDDIMSELSGLKLRAANNPAVKSGSTLFGSAFSHIPEHPREHQGLMQTPPPSDIARSIFASKKMQGIPEKSLSLRNRWSSAPQTPPGVTALSPERMDVDSDDSQTENTLIPSVLRKQANSIAAPVFQPRTPRNSGFSPKRLEHSFSPSHETVLPSDSVSQVDGQLSSRHAYSRYQPLTSDNLRQHEDIQNRSQYSKRGFTTSTQFSNDFDRATHQSHRSSMSRHRSQLGSTAFDSRFTSNRALGGHSIQPTPSLRSVRERDQFPHYNSSPSPPRSQMTRFSNIPRTAHPTSPGGYSDFSGFTTTTMVQQETNNKILFAGMAFLISLNTIVIVVVMKYFGKN